MKHVAFLIPTTSKNKNWDSVEDSLLFRNTLSTFVPEQGHIYSFFIGYDHDDVFYTKHKEAFITKFSKFKFTFIQFPKDVYKGHLTRMWNLLLEAAMNEYLFDYFYQCGDDIQFITNGWVQHSINTLSSHKDIGITGPSNNHPDLLTQVFFSRKHAEIFGFLFPEYIFNWGCDDWINKVYTPNYIYPLKNYFAKNAGGPPRYDTSKYDLKKLKDTCVSKANEEQKKLDTYIGIFFT